MTDYRKEQEAKAEAEANYFAMCLLIPEDFLRADLQGKEIDVENGALIEELAKKYQVSPWLMAQRVMELYGRKTLGGGERRRRPQRWSTT